MTEDASIDWTGIGRGEVLAGPRLGLFIMPIDPSILPANEAERIAALRRYDILDTPPDGAFDNVTRLAARLFGVPIAIISLVDTDRIWFKSHQGVDAQQIDRVPGLCASGILQCSPYVLTDAKTDPRSLTNPLVAGDAGLRFYAGVPLQTYDNFNLGMLCCLDTTPRQVTQEELDDLKCLAQLVMDQMEVRRGARRIVELSDAVKQEQLRTELAVQAGHVGIWGMDLVQGSFEWDSQMHVLYGRSADAVGALTPEAWLSFLHEEDRPRVQASWQSALNGDADFESEFRVPMTDGETRYLRGIAHLYVDEQGKPQRLLGTNWDVTAERLTLQALKEAKEAAEAAERAKGSFLANMSHELRTPLNAIIGFSDLMHADESLSEDYRHFLELINQSGNHLMTLINEVLDMAKVESGRMDLSEHDFDLPRFLHVVTDLIKLRAEQKGLRLVCELSPQLPRSVFADEMKLRQVLLNLLSNAVKFTQQGEIRLTARFDTEDAAAGGVLHCEVHDTGPGMSQEEVSGLFTPFQQGSAGRQSKEGTGLGLVLSKKFIELMGGQIAVSSQLNVGSTFAFTIRLKDSGNQPDIA
ncbi:GAF domain-containing sensor histidine kinase [Roseateles koreensis]|uniref:histidine kinase n=1 Tax=Roseateles koreensis TaxID=2987526 RepID=A0ABT5KQJ8_9BURK|nr:ATP-binding protein [Roseateles koreensis]MDC8785164.1 ATP-binding protein [Roseateles koreensis]